MNKVLNITCKAVAAALMAIMLFPGCTRNELDSSVVEGVKENLIFMQMSYPLYNTVYPKQAVVDAYAAQTASNVAFEDVVKLLYKVDHSVEASLEVDNSLVDTYNSATGNTAAALPAGLTVNLTEKVFFPADTLFSRDKVQMTLSYDGTTQLFKGDYVIPISISSVTPSKGLEISKTNGAVYIPVSISSNAIDNSTSVSGGSAITSYTGWSVLSSSPSLTNPANMLSTANSSASLSTPQELTFVIDMASERTNMRGMRFRMSAATNLWSRIKIETSMDNATWVDQGSPTLVATSSTYNYVNFTTPVPSARYLRITVLEWPSSTTSFAVRQFSPYW